MVKLATSAPLGDNSRAMLCASPRNANLPIANADEFGYPFTLAEAPVSKIAPEPRAAIHMVSDDLNAADRALPAQTQAAPAATDAQGDTQTQSAASLVSVVASSSDEDSGSNIRSLIGEIFIGFGTLLTLVSSALRMLMG